MLIIWRPEPPNPLTTLEVKYLSTLSSPHNTQSTHNTDGMRVPQEAGQSRHPSTDQSETSRARSSLAGRGPSFGPIGRQEWKQEKVLSFPNSSAEGGSAQVEPKWPTNTSRSRQTIQLQICILETGQDPSVGESSFGSEQCGVVGSSSEVTFEKFRGL